ncbi:MAG TPA: hypothetical protein VEL47_08265 [Myxococcota bacterium]|nr:hypothetical protein [Myxococcota bacterium]
MAFRRLWLCWSLAAFFLISSSNSVVAGDFLERMANARGAITIAAIYGIACGVANFFWAFNWTKRVGVSEDTGASLQEGGGLAAAALSIVFGALVPLMIYKYVNKNPSPSASGAAGGGRPAADLEPDEASNSADTERSAAQGDIEMGAPEETEEPTEEGSEEHTEEQASEPEEDEDSGNSSEV